jgi:hypothetical protein
LEWALVDAFLAADQTPVREEDLANIPAEHWPQLRFRFHPSVRLVQYGWNILPVWRAVQEGKPVPNVTDLQAQETCIVWRKGLTTRFRTLSRDEIVACYAIKAGDTFSQLCDALVQDDRPDQNTPLRAATALKTFIGSEMLTGVTLD